jgi:type IV pilus assembly protein PilC
VSVFTYPFFLITVTFGVLYFMLNNVVPMFAEVFQRFGKELPPFTQKIISASNFVGTYGIWFLSTIVIIAAILFHQRKEHWFRKLSAHILLRMPLFGLLIRKVYLARFCQAMKLLVKAKIPLVEALEMVEKMIGFVPLEEALSSVRSNLLKGSNLHTEMASHAIFDRRMVSLIKVSEEVNKLDAMFEKLANQYNDEVEHRTSVMGSLIEPLMILMIGAIVGVILVAMYQPLFNISNILE